MECVIMIYCGIDIAKYKHEASIIDNTGKSLVEGISFANDKHGCKKVLAAFEISNGFNDDCYDMQSNIYDE